MKSVIAISYATVVASAIALSVVPAMAEQKYKVAPAGNFMVNGGSLKPSAGIVASGGGNFKPSAGIVASGGGNFKPGAGIVASGGGNAFPKVISPGNAGNFRRP